MPVSHPEQLPDNGGGRWPHTGGLADDVVARITHENAMRHYQFDPFATRPKEQCTVGALRAQSPDVDTVTRVGRPADDRDLAAWQQMTQRAR